MSERAHVIYVTDSGRGKPFNSPSFLAPGPVIKTVNMEE